MWMLSEERSLLEDLKEFQSYLCNAISGTKCAIEAIE